MQKSTNAPAFSVVVPAYNEAENLEILVPRLATALAALTDSYEVVIVDNASTDDTNAVIATFSKTMPFLRLVHEPTLGYGRAVLAGLHAAQGSVLGIIRADNQERAEDLVRMYEAYCAERPVLYKAVRAHRLNDGAARIVISFFYNTLFKLMFGTRSKDLNATPKLFGRAFLDSARLESLDWFIDAEMVLKAEQVGGTVAEMTIDYLPRLKGKSSVRFRHIIEFLRNMLEWRVRMRHGTFLER